MRSTKETTQTTGEDSPTPVQTTPDSPGRESAETAPWPPALFIGLAVGALLFWPLGMTGLFALASSNTHKRNQGALVMLFAVLGFLWGWRILWPLFV